MNTKNNKTLWWLLIITVVIVLPTAIFFIAKIIRAKKIEKAKIVTYSAFGIDIPSNYTIHGIDVSSHQNYIHWPAVKAMEIKKIKIGFAFIKATEGLNDTDKFFNFNWKQLKHDSITRGAYLFFLATKSGKKQAENFIKTLPKLEKGDLPPVLDIEELYHVKPALMRERVTECLKTLESYYKIKPIIYSYADFYEQNLGNAFNNYPLWIAHYFEKEKPRVSRDWNFWQHSEKGKVNGITTNVDFNVFKGDSVAFANMLVK
jgi:lysozyme